MKTIGIIGFGSFGQFLAEKLDKDNKVLAYSIRNKKSKWSAPIDKVAQADFILLAIPLRAYKSILEQLKLLAGNNSIIVDICSVKTQPVELIRSMLPDQPLVATHPLFGPQSAKKSLEGHTFVMCPEVSDKKAYKQVEEMAKGMGLKVVSMSMEEHDKEMAVVQGLTFFIARVLDVFGLDDQQLSTPSFQKLLSLAELEEQHSKDLFYTIQSGNNFTKDVRKKFIKIAQDLDKNIP